MRRETRISDCCQLRDSQSHGWLRCARFLHSNANKPARQAAAASRYLGLVSFSHPPTPFETIIKVLC
eukprot:COSAG05_NODE_436_length_9838_cov_49.389876_14_plen_67_part_00